MDIQNWSTTANDNGSVDGINIAEHSNPANVNNAQRAQMANVAALRDLIGGKTTTGGAADAQTLTSGLGLLAYQQGLLIGFEAGFTNTGAMTLDVDGIGAKAVKTPAGAALSAGMVTAGGIYLVAYEAGADVLILLAASETVTKDSLGLDTDDTPTFAGVNVGNADTTVTRVSAGDIQVEGKRLFRVDGADVPVGDGGTGASTAADARSNLSAAAKSQTASGFYGMILGALTNRDYRIVINARRAFTITSVTTRSSSGTATATFKINTTALGGTANSVSSAEQTQNHASANAVAVGDDIVITISANAACVDLSFSINVTEALE